jgi:hypothetical protein
MSGSGDAFIYETITNTIFDGKGTPVTLNGTFEVEFNPGGTIDGVSNISLIATSSDTSLSSSTFTSGNISSIGTPAPYGGDTVNEIHVSTGTGSFQQAYIDFIGEQPTGLIDANTYGHFSSIGEPNGLESIDAASGGSIGTVTSSPLPLTPVISDTYVLTTYNNVVFDGDGEAVTLSGTMLTEYDPNGTLIGVSNVSLTASDPSDGSSYPSQLVNASITKTGIPGATGNDAVNEIYVTIAANGGGSFQHVALDFTGENPGTLVTDPGQPNYSAIGYASGTEALPGANSNLGTNTDAVQNTFLLATLSNVIFNGNVGNPGNQGPATISGTFVEEFNPGGTLVGVTNVNITDVSNSGTAYATQIGGFTAGDPNAGGYAAVNQIILQGGGPNYPYLAYIDLLGEEPNAVFAGDFNGNHSSDVGTGYQPINGYNGTGNSGVITYTQLATADAAAPATCYLRGTKLLTPAGEIAVEDLRAGDTLITRFGGYQRVKWIGRQSYAAAFISNNREQIPVRIIAGALGDNLPMRDLFISPGHSMLIGGVLILAKNLINGLTITQNLPQDQIDYFQPEFEAHDCVMAEGTWSESYADTPGLRNQFHNAAEFFRLYPDHQPLTQQKLCAPRPQEGKLLDAALRPIIAHAQAQNGTAPGALIGCIDSVANGQLEGWAQDLGQPECPVLLAISLNGTSFGTVLACDYRADLAAAGIARGFAKFSFQLPANTRLADLRVCRVSDGAEIHPPGAAIHRRA